MTLIEIKYGSDYDQVLIPQEDRCHSVGQVYTIKSGNSYTVGSKVNASFYYIRKN